MNFDFIFMLAVLLMSVVIHEVSHGYMALFLGDKTALYQNRLTLNPIRHIDIWGTIVIPFFSILLGGIVFGWAKPVPYNPYNLKWHKWGEAVVALAGPASNISLAIVAGLLIRFVGGNMSLAVFQIISIIVFVNIVLAIFNLIPVPPLDGSKLLIALVPVRFHHLVHRLESFGLIIIIILLLTFGSVIPFVVTFLFKLITGVSF